MRRQNTKDTRRDRTPSRAGGIKIDRLSTIEGGAKRDSEPEDDLAKELNNIAVNQNQIGAEMLGDNFNVQQPIINMTSLTSMNYNQMEDGFDKQNRQAFKQSISDPTLGYGDSLFDLRNKSSIMGGFTG